VVTRGGLIGFRKQKLYKMGLEEAEKLRGENKKGDEMGRFLQRQHKKTISEGGVMEKDNRVTREPGMG